MARFVLLYVFEAVVALSVIAGVAQAGGVAFPPYIQQFDSENINSVDLLRTLGDWEVIQTGAGSVCLGCNERVELTNFDAMMGVRLHPARFVLEGDADVRVDFGVSGAGVGAGETRVVGLALERAGNGVDLVAVEHVNQGGTRSYRSGGVQVGTTNVSGKLRVRRSGNAVISYYWDSIGEEWVQLDVQLAGYSGAMSFVIWTDETATSGSSYTAHFDDIAVSYPADECAQAPLIGLGQPVLYDAFLSTTNVSDPVFSCRVNGGLPGPGQGDSSQWYRFIAPDHPVTVYTCESIDEPFEFEDSLLAVYAGGCGGLVEIACGEDECVGFYSSVRLDGLVAGNEYLIQVCRHDSGTWPDIVLRIDPAVVYVDGSVVAGRAGVGVSGGSWGTAFPSLVSAFASIEAGLQPGREEVWVAEGVYTAMPEKMVDAGDRGSLRELTFTLPEGIAVRGGFPGGGIGTLANKNPLLHPTVLSGDLIGDDSGRDVIEIPAAGDPTTNNSYHVVTVAETIGSYEIDGFIIERGNADGVSGSREGSGGGMLVLGEVDVRNCTFRLNFAREGGAIGVENTLVGARLSLTKCVLDMNTGEEGSALHVGAVGTSGRVGEPLVIHTTTFSNNTVSGESGSIVRVHSGSFDVLVQSSVFAGNHAAPGVARSACLRIGAPSLVSAVPAASVLIDSSFFTNNSLTDTGVLIEAGFGGIFPELGIDLSWCFFLDNDGLVRKGGGGAALGGVVRVSGKSDTTCRLSDCQFERNTSGAGTVVVYGERAGFVVERSEFLGNRLADVDGAPDGEASPGIFADFAAFGGGARGSLRIDNSLFVRNVGGALGAALAVRGEVDAAVYNTTIASNIGDAVTTIGSGGVLEMANSIVWGSIGGASYENDLFAPFGSVLFVTSDLSGLGEVSGQSGVVVDRCFDAGPRFVVASGNGTDGMPGTEDDTIGDHRLGVGSPCIDSGDSTYPDPELVHDIQGNPRYVDAVAYADTGVGDGLLAVVDLGAYEAASGIAAPCDGDVNGDGAVDVNDLSFVLFRLGDTGGAGLVDGDANGEGVVDVNDISYVLFRLGDPC